MKVPIWGPDEKATWWYILDVTVRLKIDRLSAQIECTQMSFQKEAKRLAVLCRMLAFLTLH